MFSKAVVEYSLRHYKAVTVVMAVFTLALGAMIPRIRIDTDPENMLSGDEPVRVFHNQTKDEFNLSDIVVAGIVNNRDPNGVFNPASLQRIYELTQFAKGLRWVDEEDPEREVGVIEVDIIAPSEVDHISQGSAGQVNFEWLMRTPPGTAEEALAVRDRAMSNPMLKGTLVSEDGKAICLYLPLTSKDLSYRVYSALNEKIATFEGDEEYHITGLPVAEDTFGVEMFIQMAVSAPLAMLVIFVLMLLFFRKLVLIISPMIIAMVSVISTMGLLIGLGYPVHIMSSMIPIFLMPIAVVDSVHILSEFFDLYTPQKGRKGTITEVMGHLFTAMLYTSLTSAAGFASLALTPIPPVQVFGLFVAIGIMIAWVFTVTFVPAYVMMVSDKSLANFGHEARHGEKETWLSRILARMGGFTYTRAKPILIVLAAMTAVAIYGVSRIQINDNPVKWFSKSHPIRQADIELNKHFAGTYMAYLVLQGTEGEQVTTDYVDTVRARLLEKGKEVAGDYKDALSVTAQAEKLLLEEAEAEQTKEEYLLGLADASYGRQDEASGENAELWGEIAVFFEWEAQRLQTFKQPAILKYVSALQNCLEKEALVGKSNSVADVVKKVHQEFIDGRPENYIVPDSARVASDCLSQFQNSHNPEDLWHLVTYNYRKANIWIQLKSGDNKDMEEVAAAVDRYFEKNPPPVPLKYDWAGLTYINTVWQDKMVWGMLQSFLGSFIIVFIMMAILFRSALWGLVCMVPLTITIVVIYGIIGLVGKDYDMPVAVLSALTLGMAVDFAIHFLERARESYKVSGSWEAAAPAMFGEPARAISRNVLVIAIGFLPLLAAPLVPYKTVGIFLCSIMALSGGVTLFALPAILKSGERLFFRPVAEPKSPVCNCGLCLAVSNAAVVLVALTAREYWDAGWNALVWVGLIVIPVMALICGVMSRRRACRNFEEKKRKFLWGEK